MSERGRRNEDAHETEAGNKRLLRPANGRDSQGDKAWAE